MESRWINLVSKASCWRLRRLENFLNTLPACSTLSRSYSAVSSGDPVEFASLGASDFFALASSCSYLSLFVIDLRILFI